MFQYEPFRDRRPPERRGNPAGPTGRTAICSYAACCRETRSRVTCPALNKAAEGGWLARTRRSPPDRQSRRRLQTRKPRYMSVFRNLWSDEALHRCVSILGRSRCSTDLR